MTAHCQGQRLHAAYLFLPRTFFVVLTALKLMVHHWNQVPLSAMLEPYEGQLMALIALNTRFGAWHYFEAARASSISVLRNVISENSHLLGN